MILESLERTQATKEPRLLYIKPSCLFVYYNVRETVNEVDLDRGASIGAVMKSVQTHGVCPSYLWPYEPGKLRQRPPDACYDVANSHRVTSCIRLAQEEQVLENALQSNRLVVFGAEIYESVVSGTVTKSGNVPKPLCGEQHLGASAFVLYGYDRAIRCFSIQSTWGKRWGKEGRGTMPYDYVLDKGLCFDFWTINGMTQPLDTTMLHVHVEES